MAASRAAGGPASGAKRASSTLASVDFEIFGKVQGVFFRKHTKATADRLKIVGWVANAPSGTVIGQAQGEEANVNEMKRWLSTTGSPKSSISDAKFSNEGRIRSLQHREFSIRK